MLELKILETFSLISLFQIENYLDLRSIFVCKVKYIKISKKQLHEFYPFLELFNPYFLVQILLEKKKINGKS